ncbi:hypothetical protein FNT36_11895 [Hymenobacter setariae]|uniref:T9SS C-terminal target domain-containing protein n=1 Tax=Hymenobacter setariae TaxID=2594794 RepID=A0A558BUI8_9BACT|nr:T9SS type A sorting domain-containing protein [Hymenobacter setariae]TVT40187.1 hypothetical protein FNT36_11895 [Hymenobacter setariae]
MRNIRGSAQLWAVLLSLLALAARAQAPLLRLDLQDASSRVPAQAYIYAQEGATTGFDDEYDATPPSGNGLNLNSLTQNGRRLTVNGLPYAALTASQVVNLFVGVPQYGPYTLLVGRLENFSFAKIYLVDAEQQTRQLLAAGTTYSLSLTAANTGGTYSTSTRFSLVFESAAPLPVTLTDFTAQLEGGDGLLRWTTASEQQSAYFQVESSPDGRTFTALGRAASAGTSSERHTYQFRDANLARYAAAQVYYRLRQVDADGVSVLSAVRVLMVPAVDLVVTALPTAGPAGQALSLVVRAATAGPAQLRITDVLGHSLGQRALALPAGTSTIGLPESAQWAPGLYFVQVQQGAQRQIARVVRL